MLIIWTNQRTGGTTLARVIEEHFAQQISHEPFNRKRVFGEITKAFDNGIKDEELSQKIKAVLSKKVALKHCVELVPLELSFAVIREVRGNGYKHVFLTRNFDCSRLLSLAMARKTGIWGPNQKRTSQTRENSFDLEQLIEHEKRSRHNLTQTNDFLIRLNEPVLCLEYNMLYSQSAAIRSAEVTKLNNFLNIDVSVDYSASGISPTRHLLTTFFEASDVRSLTAPI